MSKPYNYMANQHGPGRRSARDYEMRPLRPSSNTSYNDPSSSSSSSSSNYTRSSLSSTSSSPTSASRVNTLIDKLKSSSWDDRFKFSRGAHHRKERKKFRSRFAVNVPTRLIFHLIIVFFLIPLTLGALLLIRALFFGLKEDANHPLHKKIPKSHLKKMTTSTTVNDISGSGSATNENDGNSILEGSKAVEGDDLIDSNESKDGLSNITSTDGLNTTIVEEKSPILDIANTSVTDLIAADNSNTSKVANLTHQLLN